KRLLPAVERELREAQQRHEQRRAERELQLLETTGRAATEAKDVLSALSVTLEKMCDIGGWTIAQAWLPQTGGGAIECSSAWFCRDGSFEEFRRNSLEHPCGEKQD